MRLLSRAAASGQPWAVLLAGGRGARMKDAAREWLGTDRPKQFCTFVGRRSMLQTTRDRMSGLVEPERTVVVLGKGQRAWFDEAVSPHFRGAVLEQPDDRGTAAAVFLAAAHVAERDPQATLFISPCDHHIDPVERFREQMESALTLTRRHPQRLVLMGAVPDGPETDYGWLVLREPVAGPLVHRVRRFVEKPVRSEARKLFRAGALWNTMILTANVQTLWNVGWQALPDMLQRFESLRQVERSVMAGRVDAAQLAMVVRAAYRATQPADFSRSVLSHHARSCLSLRLTGIRWSDLGRPERVRQLGRLAVAAGRAAAAPARRTGYA